jgi:hypothetical protein
MEEKGLDFSHDDMGPLRLKKSDRNAAVRRAANAGSFPEGFLLFRGKRETGVRIGRPSGQNNP